MKIERKRVDKISISHNKGLLIVIIILIAVLAVIISIILKNNTPVEKECVNDEDCVASSCCHAESCVSEDRKPVCDKIFCSQVCSGPLDCNLGHCGCINGKCSVINDNK